MTRRLIFAAVALAGLVQVIAVTTATAREAERATPAATTTDVYNYGTRRCLEVPETRELWVDAQTDGCESASWQRWQFRRAGDSNGTPLYTIYNNYSGLCLGLEGTETDGYARNGYDVQQEPCDGGRDTKWWVSSHPESGRRIRSYIHLDSGVYPCMEADDWNPVGGYDQAQIWTCAGGEIDQAWSFSL